MSMEAIEKELQDKMIEKPSAQITELADAQIVEKKPRSEAQIKAFEKARAKRMENLKNKAASPERKEIVFNNEVEIKEISPLPLEAAVAPQKKKRGRPRGIKNKKVIEPNYPHPVEHSLPQAQPPQYQFQGHHYAPPPPQYYHPPPQPQAPVNNYYYYGGAPQPQQVFAPDAQAPPFVEDDEVYEEEDEVQENEYVEQPVEATLRYRFV